MNTFNQNFFSKTALLLTIFVVSNILISCKGLRLNIKFNDTNQTEHSAGLTQDFVNSPNNIRGDARKRRNYVDFSFKYPDTWKIVPEKNDNYVKVERSASDGNTIENFNVGSLGNIDKVEGNEDELKKLANELSNQSSQAFPEYIKKSEGKTKIGSYDGYEFRFVSTSKNIGFSKDEQKLWGRVVMIPDGTGKGVLLAMLVSSRSTEVKGVEDVGVKGELPIIINSFKFSPASEINGGLAEYDIKDSLNKSSVSIKKITCPKKISKKINTIFQCEVKSDIGLIFLEGKVINQKGEYELTSKNFITIAAVEKQVAEEFQDESIKVFSVKCEGKDRLTKSGDVFQCKVKDDKGKIYNAPFTIY
jgi:hypothetical protein